MERTTDINGERIVFCNTELFGYGCQGYYARNSEKEKYDGNVCYIDRIECYAEEAYFGGIAISVAAIKSK